MSAIYRRQAWKPVEHEGRRCITPCEWNDEAATEFRIGYAGSTYASTTIDLPSRLQAERVCWALDAVYGVGRAHAMADLRRFIGA